MNKLVPALFGILAGAVVGAGVMWFVLSEPGTPQPNAGEGSEVARQDDEDRTTTTTPRDDGGEPEDNQAFKDAQRQVSDLKREVTELSDDKEDLQGEVDRLKARVAELEAEPEDEPTDEDEATGDKGNMAVSFGEWEKLKELKEADWKELGKTIETMHDLLKEVGQARRDGKDIDPALGTKIQSENRKLVQHYIKVMGKLPTNAPTNGEFSHPINLVNFLAGQLESAGDPLSESQLSQLSELGEDFERRWNEKQEGYDETTWNLQKLIDEVELKEWFRVEMFRITTPQQKAIAVPPEIEGTVGLDLYSPGVILQTTMDVVRAGTVTEIKGEIKTRMEKSLSIERSLLDSAEYLFDEWTATLSTELQPQTEGEAAVMYTRDVVASGKAQLSALTQFEQAYVTDEKKKESFRALRTILFPQVILEQ
jgi:hypothetical protein